ncbi:Ig-like domain repeat protein [Nocardia sp. NPDC059091]|uniref:Ig-like domain repeat protein n=1 Tax=unclassified Nocardia TaxID=2637762 RepID=UPI003691D4AB
MHAFDSNDYRKRVLAAVERRGGLGESDAFELYDIPLAEAARLSDAEVAARVEAVWAFWQKLRDHPKYRVLAGLLVDAHAELSEPLLHTGSRLVAADRVTQLRARREAERYEMLDAAIERLVARHGGVPAAKIPGLEDIGRMGGLTVAEIAARVRRHRIIDEASAAPSPSAAPALSSERRRQIRALLAEYERLLPGDPVPTLLALLGMEFAAAHHTNEIRLRAGALRARTRELPPGRIRVVLDELLIHIGDILEPGGAMVDAYLLAITETVTDQLRPQVRAAVLVEDLLVAADFDYLLGVAIAAGLDRAAAERILITLTDELGTTVEGREHLAAPPRSGGPAQTSSAATTSTRSTGNGAPSRTGAAAGSEFGRDPASNPRGKGPAASDTGDSAGGFGPDRDAATAAGSAGGSSGTGGGPRYSGGGAPVRGRGEAPEAAQWQRTPYTGEAAGAGAGRPWEAALRAARASLRAGRPREAAGFVTDARRGVGDDGLGARSVRAVGEEVERVLAEAAVHWRAAVSCCAGRRFVEALGEHLDFLDRRAADVPNPDPRGAGRELLIGRARAAVMEAGRLFEALPSDPGLRMQAVRAVLEVCADHAEALAALAELQVGAPGTVTVSRKPDGTVVITWLPSRTTQVEYRVTRLVADGSWRVVGRTRGTALEDGGAPTGPVPVYGVVASVSGRASEMARSDGDSDRDTAQGGEPDAAGGGPDGDRPSGMPTVRSLTEQRGLLVFEWPIGITEVMVVARPDAPPVDPEDPRAHRWKVTNMRYEIDGGVRIPSEIPRPCHVAVASCRRDTTGTLTVAAGFGPNARIRWVR